MDSIIIIFEYCRDNYIFSSIIVTILKNNLDGEVNHYWHSRDVARGSFRGCETLFDVFYSDHYIIITPYRMGFQKKAKCW